MSLVHFVLFLFPFLNFFKLGFSRSSRHVSMSPRRRQKKRNHMNQTLSMSLSLWWVVLSTSNMVSSPDNAAYRISGSSPEDLLTGVELSNSTMVEVVSSRRSSLSLINLFAPEKAEDNDPFTPTWRVLSRGEKTLRSGLDLLTKAAHTSDVSELSQSRDWPDEP